MPGKYRSVIPNLVYLALKQQPLPITGTGKLRGTANVAARIGALAVFDIADRLAEIATPTLLIAAEDDMLVPDLCSERLEQGLPHARLERMRGGHACNITEPGDFNRHVLEFLGD